MWLLILSIVKILCAWLSLFHISRVRVSDYKIHMPVFNIFPTKISVSIVCTLPYRSVHAASFRCLPRVRSLLGAVCLWYVKYSGPCDLRPLHLKILSNSRLTIGDTSFIFSI